MPKYEVEIPGRGKFDVESPTELTDAQAYQAVMAQIGPAPVQEKGIGAAAKTARIDAARNRQRA